MKLLLLALFISFSATGQAINFNNAKVDNDIKSLIKKNSSVGASIVITSPTTILYQGNFGKADTENNTPVTGETLFGLGSITKTFTALAILRLVDAGKIKLSDRVLDIAPELPILNRWGNNHPVRIIHLLEHTSGFDEVHPKDRTIAVNDDEYPLFKGITQVKNSIRTRWQPGSRFAYSNVGYLVAGYIVEKASGKSYNEYIKSEVLAPLQMDKSAIRLNEINTSLLAKSYAGNRKALPFMHVFTRPTASIYSSANDMSNFLMMLLNKGKINEIEFLNSGSFNEFETHHSIKLFDNTENGYRLGVFPKFYNGVKWYGHGGAFNGYKTEFEYSHTLQIGIYVVSNGPNSNKTVADILEIIHNQFDVKTKEISSRVIAGNNESFTGLYLPVSPRNQLLYPFTELFTGGLIIKNTNEQLSISGVEGTKTNLYLTDNNKLSPYEDSFGYQYIFDASKNTLLTSLGFAYERKPLILVISLALVILISFGWILISQLIFGIRITKLIWRRESIVWGAQTFLELSSSLFILGIVAFLVSVTSENIHELNLQGIALFLSTSIYPLLFIIGLFYLVKDWLKMRSSFNKVYLIGLITSLLFSVTYLFYWNLLGFRIWSY